MGILKRMLILVDYLDFVMIIVGYDIELSKNLCHVVILSMRVCLIILFDLFLLRRYDLRDDQLHPNDALSI